MRGELIGVWSETWREIWLPLIERPLAEDDECLPEDIFCELYRALEPALSPRPSVENLADIIGDPVQSREAFEATTANDLAGERFLVDFFEAAHEALEDLDGDELSNRYFNLLASFIDKFSLRYDLRRPCILYPTLPEVFASLVSDLRALTNQDPHLNANMKDFEDAVRELREPHQDLHPEADESPGGDRSRRPRRHRNHAGCDLQSGRNVAAPEAQRGDEEPVRVCLGLPRYSPRRDAGVRAACGGHARHGGNVHLVDRFHAIP